MNTHWQVFFEFWFIIPPRTTKLSECGPISTCVTDTLIQPEYPVLLWILSGEFCLRLKPYWVVKISSDVVTEHCCQVCVLSMMFCHFDCRLVLVCVVSDYAIRKLLITHVLTLRQANMGYEKYSLHLIFTFYLNRDTSVLELFPVVVFQEKRFTRQSKPSLKLLHSAKKIQWRSYQYILLQTRTHIMMISQHVKCFTSLFCPRLVRNVWSRWCFDSSSIIAHPVNFDIHSDTVGEIIKMGFQELDIYLSIYIYRYYPLGNRYGFSISVQPEITPLFIFFSMLKKNAFQKFAGLWLDGEVVNHVELYGSMAAEGCSAFQRRSCWQCSCHRIIL